MMSNRSVLPFLQLLGVTTMRATQSDTGHLAYRSMPATQSDTGNPVPSTGLCVPCNAGMSEVYGVISWLSAARINKRNVPRRPSTSFFHESFSFVLNSSGRGVGTGGQGGGRPPPQKKIGTGAAPPLQTKKHRKAQKNDESV